MSNEILNYVLAGGALLIQVVAIFFVARVSHEYLVTIQDIKKLKDEFRLALNREKRNKLLAEKLYELAISQSRLIQRIGVLSIYDATEADKHVKLREVLSAVEELCGEIEITSHEVGLFSASREIREKALRSLAFGVCGKGTLSLLDELIQFDTDDDGELRKYRRLLVDGLWGERYKASAWTGVAE